MKPELWLPLKQVLRPSLARVLQHPLNLFERNMLTKISCPFPIKFSFAGSFGSVRRQGFRRQLQLGTPQSCLPSPSHSPPCSPSRYPILLHPHHPDSTKADCNSLPLILGTSATIVRLPHVSATPSLWPCASSMSRNMSSQ